MKARRWVVVALFIAALIAAPLAAAEEEPTKGGADNVREIATDPLQGRSAYQPILVTQGSRRLLYVGHHSGRELNPMNGRMEDNGTSVLDVTDPRHPRYLTHIPVTPSEDDATMWPPGAAEFLKTGAQHVQICSGDDLPKGQKGRFYLLRNRGNLANEILDVTDPEHPRLVTRVADVERSNDDRAPYRTHKNLWDCASGLAFIPSTLSGWSPARVTRIFDLSDPARPSHIRDFGLPGSQPGGKGIRLGAPEGVHEATIYRNRVVLAYGAFYNGVVQILDRKKLIEGDPRTPDPMAPTETNLRYPVISQLTLPPHWGAHSAKPLLDVAIPDYQADAKGAIRDFLMVTSEGINYPCNRTRDVVLFVDITDEQYPTPVSNFQVPAHGGRFDFCKRGAFGPHAPNASNAYGGRVVALSYFVAGVRIIDVRDPFHPIEIGYFIPDATKATIAAIPRGATAPKNYAPTTVTNNIEVDDRGYIFAVDRVKTGLHILELTGQARSIALGR